MATPKVLANVTSAWTNVIGSAANVAGLAWQNVGPSEIQIAFTTLEPAGGPTDAYMILPVRGGYYDVNGSAACWVRSIGSAGSTISGTAD